MITVFVVIIVSVVLQAFQIYMVSPVRFGSVVPPGTWITKCGLMRLTPYCDDSLMHVDSKGNVILYNSQNEIMWQIEGAVCKRKDKSCVEGMKVTKEGKIIVGGKHITYITKFGTDYPLSPWPFEEEPKVKTWLKNQQVISS
jgi:hypothetical protein